MERFEEFNIAGSDLYARGLVDTRSGNMSIRVGSKIYITRRNSMLGHLKEADIVEVQLEGPGEGDSSASRELPVHRAIYRETSFNAIVHAHPPYGTALSLVTENKIAPLDSEGQLILRGIPIVRTKEKIASEEAAKLLPPIFKSNYPVAIIREHGSFAVGADLYEALYHTTCMECSCKIIAINKAMSKPEVKREVEREHRRSAIPPGIGVMDRTRGFKRGFGR
jgi:L-fuculose-phosphate aldolase